MGVKVEAHLLSPPRCARPTPLRSLASSQVLLTNARAQLLETLHPSASDALRTVGAAGRPPPSSYARNATGPASPFHGTMMSVDMVMYL